MSGACLFVVASPIGNLGDLSARVRETLDRVALVAAEDTRRTRALLSHLGLHKRILRCDEAREARASGEILSRLGAGDSAALLSDAGVPTISDPGSRLVRQVHEAGYPVVPIPGPSAVTTALAASGFPATPYAFLGFLPRKGKKRARILERLTEGEMTCVLFESPHRLARTLSELAESLPGRSACVAREMTKLHEEIVRGDLPFLARRFPLGAVRGECTIVVGPRERT